MYDEWHGLTPIERRVLGSLAKGEPSASIASALGLSSEEVNVVVEDIMTKLQAASGPANDARLDSYPLDPTETDHPHIVEMNEVQTLIHLRSRHGHVPPRAERFEDLRLLHERLHHDAPPTPA